MLDARVAAEEAAQAAAASQGAAYRARLAEFERLCAHRDAVLERWRDGEAGLAARFTQMETRWRICAQALDRSRNEAAAAEDVWLQARRERRVLEHLRDRRRRRFERDRARIEEAELEEANARRRPGATLGQ